MPSINTSIGLILFCIGAILFQFILSGAATLYAIDRINKKLSFHITILNEIIENAVNHVRKKVDNDFEYAQKKVVESPTESREFFLEIQTIQKDIRSILHDSRHIQNECLQTNYAIQSILNEMCPKIDMLCFTQNTSLQVMTTISLQNQPLLSTYLDQLNSNIENMKIRDLYQFERNIRLMSPSLMIPPASSKMAILSIAYNAEERRQVEACIESHKKYSKIHGYAYYLQDKQPIYQHKKVCSDKVSAIFSLLNEGFDTVLFVNCSVMFTNFDKSIDHLFYSLVSNNASFVVAENEFGVDLTVFAVKNCTKSKIILNLIWLLQRQAETIASEEEALNHLMNNYDLVRQQVYIEKISKNLNSEPREKGLSTPVLKDKIWSDGDLICNFSGFRPPHLEALVKRYAASFAFRDGKRAEAMALNLEKPIEFTNNKDVSQGGTVSCSILGRWGQFGNQLFQIAAVFGYARKYGAQVILPKWYCVMSEQDHGSRFQKIRSYYSQQPGADSFHETNYSYEEIPYKNHIDLYGSFQSEKYFSHARDEVRNLFAEPQEIRIHLDEFIDKHDCKIFDALHIRNYLHPTRDIGYGDMERLPEEYFIAAIHRINDTIPLFVATDKRDFVEELFRKTGLRRRIVMMDNDDPLMDFYMLSRARRIAISNSSFSWWSAYLGSEKENVIAPHRYYWFSSKGRCNPRYDTRDLYPANFEEIIM